MKKRLSLFLCLALAFLCLGTVTAAPVYAEAARATFTPGTYEGRAESTGGEILVSVTVSEHAIESVEVLKCNDTDGLKNVPLERIPAAVVESQSLNVDGVSGATLTSLFLRNAIKDAVSKATDDLSMLNEKVEYKAPAQKDMEADVVVVGGGSAGLASAAQAGAYGLKVVLIERNAFLGGTSLLSDAGVAETTVEYLAAERENFEEFLHNVGIDYNKIEMDWKGSTLGVLYFPADEGRSIMASSAAVMENFALEHNVTILKDTSVTGLITENGKVVGVEAMPAGQDSFRVTARAVILATGGFARDKALISEYMPQYADVMPCNIAGAKGEAIGWLEPLGVKLVNMASELQWYPASEKLSAHSMGSTAGIYVDPTGKLINETNNYSDTARAAFHLIGQKTYYQILSHTDMETFGLAHEVESGLEAGRVFSFATIDEIAETYDLPSLAETIAEIAYGDDGGYYVCPVRPYMYSTYGGIGIDQQGHVLTADDTVIPGLYAAGEVTGSADYLATGIYSGQLGQGMQQGIIAARTVTEEIG